MAKTESSARLAEQPERPGQPQVKASASSISADDRRLVSDSLPGLAASRQFAMEYLYARLFVQSPELRSLFPLSMERTRITTFDALVKLVGSLRTPEVTDRLLSQLGKDHRRFGVKDSHYQPFFTALLATVEQVSGRAWTGDVALAWRSVLSYFADAMKAAAAADALTQPAWWIGEIVQHDLRTPTVAVLTIRPDKPLTFVPGQYVAVQVPRWPRMWRKYSVANAPRDNGLLDLHVRAVPGGMVSNALVSQSGTGDIVTLSAARGDLRNPADPDRDIVGIAGGTGLAPIKAIVEAIVGETRQGKRRSVTLYIGARSTSDLYDMRDLATLRLAYPALTLVPVAEAPDLEAAGKTGRLPEIIRTHPSFRETEIFVAGPAGLISATRKALAARVPADRFHHDPLDLLTAASRPAPGLG